MTIATRFCKVPFNITRWEFPMCQALCKALQRQADTLPSKSPHSRGQGSHAKVRLFFYPPTEGHVAGKEMSAVVFTGMGRSLGQAPFSSTVRPFWI